MNEIELFNYARLLARDAAQREMNLGTPLSELASVLLSLDEQFEQQLAAAGDEEVGAAVCAWRAGFFAFNYAIADPKFGTVAEMVRALQVARQSASETGRLNRKTKPEDDERLVKLFAEHRHRGNYLATITAELNQNKSESQTVSRKTVARRLKALGLKRNR